MNFVKKISIYINILIFIYPALVKLQLKNLFSKNQKFSKHLIFVPYSYIISIENLVINRLYGRISINEKCNKQNRDNRRDLYEG